MSWLEDLLSAGRRSLPVSPSAPGMLNPSEWDDQQLAQDARFAAAERMSKGAKRRAPELTSPVAPPLPNMGMLSQDAPVAEPVAPPSVSDPMAREPEPHLNGVPIPRPRIPGQDEYNSMDAEADQRSSPMSMAPPEANPAALPPNATPTVGGPVGGPPQAEPGTQGVPGANSPPGIGGILGKIFDPANAPLLLAMGGGFAGAPSFGTGMGRGFSAAAPAAAMLRKEQLLNMNNAETYRSLVARGVSPQEALAATRDPEIKKAVVAKYFETKPPELKEVARDRFGLPIMGVFNAQAQTINGEPAAEFLKKHAQATLPFGGEVPPAGYPTIPPQEDGAPAVVPLGDNMLPANAKPVADDARQRYLDSLNNPSLANTVKAISEGREQYPTGQVMRTPFGKMIQEALHTYDPAFDQVNYQARQRTRNDYTSGLASRVTKSVNTTIDHGYQLYNTIDKLGNLETLPMLNTPMNAVRGQLSKEYQAAKADFDAGKEVFVKELDTALSGGKPTVSGQKAIRDEFNAQSSPVTQRAYIQSMMGKLQSRLLEHTDTYNKGMGLTIDPVSFISEKNRSHFDQLLNSDPTKAHGATQAPSPAAAPRLSPGQTTTINGVTIKRLD